MVKAQGIPPFREGIEICTDAKERGGQGADPERGEVGFMSQGQRTSLRGQGGSATSAATEMPRWLRLEKAKS